MPLCVVSLEEAIGVQVEHDSLKEVMVSAFELSNFCFVCIFWPWASLCTLLRNWNRIMCNSWIKSLCNVQLFQFLWNRKSLPSCKYERIQGKEITSFLFCTRGVNKTSFLILNWQKFCVYRQKKLDGGDHSAIVMSSWKRQNPSVKWDLI